MEDSSSSRPVSVQAACIKESVALLEQEVVSDQLLLVGFTHSSQWIVFTSKFPSETRKNPGNFCLHFIPLLFGDTRPKRIAGQVSTNSDSCRVNHFRLFFCEWWALQLGVVHVTHMLSIFRMFVVIFNHLVKELFKGGVRIMGTGIDTNS